MWKGLIVLLGCSCFLIFVEGERLAVKMCNKYRTYFPDPVYKQSIKLGPPSDGDFPHHALLGYLKNGTKNEYDFKCGGTLISDRHVLTAAHCFGFQYPSVVRLGVYDVLKSDGHQFTIEGFFRHPEHSYLKVYHDIAIVKLADRVIFSKSIRPACLWDTESRNTSHYIATGFGYSKSHDGLRSARMMQTRLEEFPAADCSRVFKLSSRLDKGIQDGQLCIGTTFESRDTCLGDSGTPLLTLTYPGNSIYHVVGITSAGVYGCGVGRAKAVYTKVSYYLKWIEENVWRTKANVTD